MTTTLNIFMPDEVIQVLDDSTGIYEEARVIALESDWSIRITWLNWSGKKPLIFTLPDNLRNKGVESWTIRKRIVPAKASAATGTNGRPVRQAAQPPPIISGPYQPFVGYAHRIIKTDEVRSFTNNYTFIHTM